ncbi:MAG: hypothetical protein EOS34_33035 [Mesorhizobium sp.]|nr:MAG: hypothetical protein EOS34_33035 [Mesorhizobium sp.]
MPAVLELTGAHAEVMAIAQGGSLPAADEQRRAPGPIAALAFRATRKSAWSLGSILTTLWRAPLDDDIGFDLVMPASFGTFGRIWPATAPLHVVLDHLLSRAFCVPDFRLIFAPMKGHNEPEILLYQLKPILSRWC